MKIEDVKVGMWVRVTGDTRVSRVRSLRDTTVCFDGNPGWAFASACEPWVPEVGEPVWHHDPSLDVATPTVVVGFNHLGVALVREPAGLGGRIVPTPGYCHVEPRFTDAPEDPRARETPQAKRFAVGDKVTVRDVPGVWVVSYVTGGQHIALHRPDNSNQHKSALVEHVEACVPEAPEQAKPTELVVGRWYVTESSRTPWRVTHVLCGGADVKSPTGTIATIHAKDLTPWVPQVGDWVVRSSRSGEREAPTTVRQVSTAPGSESTVQLADGCAAYLVPGPMLFHVEPCPPPTVSVQVAPPAPETRTMACEWEESDIYPCDCPRCTGPVSTLLCMPCMGRDWRTWEPETRHMWRRPDGVVRPLRENASELVWLATGRGVEALHPLRDEAVRLWRAKVKR